MSLLALLGGALMASTAAAAPRVDVNWTTVVYKDAAGKDQTVTIITEDPDPGYHGRQGLVAVAVKNDVVFKGDYRPMGSRAKIKVTVRDRDDPMSAGDEYTGTFGKGKWEITIPKGKLQVATVYEITVEATINDLPVFMKYCMNTANN